MNRAAAWSRALARSRRSLWLIAVLSFLENTVLPVPIEVVLIPHMLVNRPRLWTIANAAIAGSVVAALAGYAVGFLLFESLGRWLLETFEYQDAFAAFQQQFHRYGFLAVLAIGVTPVPFQVATLTAGMTGYALLPFLLASLVGRGIRYYAVALAVHLFGDRALRLWRSHSRLVSIAVGVVLVVGAYVLGVFAADS